MLDNTNESAEEILRRLKATVNKDPKYCEHRRFKGHHIECVSQIKRIRWYECLDCHAVFAPTPHSD